MTSRRRVRREAGGTAPLTSPHVPWVLPALLVLMAYVGFRWGLAVIRLPAGTAPGFLLAASALSALGAIGLPIAGIAAVVRAGRSPRFALLVAAAGLALWLGTLSARPVLPWRELLAALQDLGKILTAAGVGVALAGGIREPNILLPAGIFAAFADFVVVNFGTVRHALSTPKGQAMVQAVSASVPAVHPSLPQLTIGPADFLFLGILLACARRFEMGLARNAVVLALVLAAALVAVPFLGPVPALAPMALAFVVTNWRRFRLTREEMISTAVVLVVMGALFLAYFLLVFPARR